MAETDVTRTIDAVWRIESARLIAGLARIVRDVGVAEELAQDALVAALERWPRSGMPDNPAAWLTATAKHRAIDYIRRTRRLDGKLGEIATDAKEHQSSADDIDARIDDDIGDDMLRLVFVACHPVLSIDAWMLRLSRRVQIALGCAGVFAIAVFLPGWESLPGQPKPWTALSRPLDVADYVVLFLARVGTRFTGL